MALRAAFLNLLRGYDHELSGQVHESNSVRSYSLDPFPCDSRFQTYLDEGEECTFGVNLFDAGPFEDIIRHIALCPKPELRVYHHCFSIRKIDFSRHRPASLMERWTAGLDSESKTPIRVRMRFITPAQLSQFGSDRAFLLPSPEKVFTGLLRVWNTVGDATTLERTGGYHDWVRENVYVSGHDLRTVKVSLGRQRKVIGFVGNIIYNIEPSNSPLLALTVGLSRFAEICNVGKNRTAGFGKVAVEVDGVSTAKNKGYQSERGVLSDVHTTG